MDLPTRKKNRLDRYDYSSRGAYFITICVTDRNALLWEQGVEVVQPDQPPLSAYGRIVDTAIRQITAHYDNIILDQYCIMPDHVHMLVFILPVEHVRSDSAQENQSNAARVTLQTMVGSMKRWVSKQIGFSIWQKSFHDTILWNHAGYLEVCQYIYENPLHQSEDSIESLHKGK